MRGSASAFIQQAVMQVLQRRWDRTFSEHSYGFRPKRSAHRAVAAAQQYIAEGYRWVVDLDLEKFFDRVNHDKLMAKIAERVNDKRSSTAGMPSFRTPPSGFGISTRFTGCGL
jgi:retron-type reverse transcriptase